MTSHLLELSNHVTKPRHANGFFAAFL